MAYTLILASLIDDFSWHEALSFEKLHGGQTKIKADIDDQSGLIGLIKQLNHYGMRIIEIKWLGAFREAGDKESDEECHERSGGYDPTK